MFDLNSPNINLPRSQFYAERPVSTANDYTASLLYQQCVAALTSSPNRADILLRVDSLPADIQVSLIEKLLTHSKVGTLSIYGMPRSARILVAAEAVLMDIHVRFVETEDEMKVILAKRRAVDIAARVPDVHPSLLAEHSPEHTRGTAW